MPDPILGYVANSPPAPPDLASLRHGKFNVHVVAGAIATHLAEKLDADAWTDNLQALVDRCTVLLIGDTDDAKTIVELAIEHRTPCYLAASHRTSLWAQELLNQPPEDVTIRFENQLFCLPGIQVIRQRLKSGELGAAGLLRSHRWEPITANNSTPIDQMRDEIELAVDLFGEPPTSVYAQTIGADAEYLQLHLGFANGGMALCDYQRQSDRAPYLSYSLIGAKGAVYSDDHHNQQLVFGNGETRAHTTSQTKLRRYPLWSEFISELDTPTNLLKSVRDTMTAVEQSLQTCEAINMEAAQ